MSNLCNGNPLPEPKDESTGQSPVQATSNTATVPQKRTAFSELKWSNAPKPKQQKIEPSKQQENKPSASSHSNTFASGLLPYVLNPDSFPTTVVLRQTEHTILIRDQYPKALVHLLLLPRDPTFYNLTPFQAFNKTDPEHTAFLDLIRSEAQSVLSLAASELSRLVSPYSKTCIKRNEFLDTFPEPLDGKEDTSANTLKVDAPPARDFLQEFKIGIHAEPSMNTLHIHIASVDNYSVALKHKKHYNTFNSRFFISLSDFPLTDDDERMQIEKQTEYIKGDMTCWRCSTNYGNKFKQLKSHLEDEYREWRSV